MTASEYLSLCFSFSFLSLNLLFRSMCIFREEGLQLLANSLSYYLSPSLLISSTLEPDLKLLSSTLFASRLFLMFCRFLLWREECSCEINDFCGPSDFYSSLKNHPFCFGGFLETP